MRVFAGGGKLEVEAVSWKPRMHNERGGAPWMGMGRLDMILQAVTGLASLDVGGFWAGVCASGES